MKSFFLALTVIALGVTSAFAADDRNVTVVNGTGYAIKFLGFNNPGDNEWSDPGHAQNTDRPVKQLEVRHIQKRGARGSPF